MWSNLSAAAKAPSPIIVLFPAKQKCFHFLFSQQPKNFHFSSISKSFCLQTLQFRVKVIDTLVVLKLQNFHLWMLRPQQVRVQEPEKKSSYSDVLAVTKKMWCSCCDKDDVIFVLWQKWWLVDNNDNHHIHGVTEKPWVFGWDVSWELRKWENWELFKIFNIQLNLAVQLVGRQAVDQILAEQDRSQWGPACTLSTKH